MAASGPSDTQEYVFFALHQLAVAAGGLHDPVSLAELLVDHARAIVKADSAALYLLDDSHGLRQLARTERDQPGPEVRLARGEGAGGGAIERREPVLVDDYRTWPATTPRVQERGFRSGAAVPLLVQSQAIGALVASGLRPHFFVQDDLAVLALLAAQIAPVLEISRLYGQSEERTQQLEARTSELEAAYRELSLLQETSQTVLDSQDLQEIVHAILKRAMEAGDYDLGNIRLLNRERTNLVPVASGGYRHPERIVHQSVGSPARGGQGQGRFDQAMNRTTRVVEDLAQAEGFTTLREEGARSIVTVPILAQQEVLGIIQLASRVPRQFSAAELRVLEAIGSQMGIAVQKAQLHEATRRAYAELQVTEEKHRRLAEIIEATPDFVIMVDAALEPQYLNRSAQVAIGSNESSNAGLILADAQPAWAREQIQKEILPALKRDSMWRGESAFLTPDHREIPVSSVVLAHRSSDGTVRSYTTIARDISERKQLEQQLERLSATDGLTGVANRRHFDLTLAAEWRRAMRQKTSIALAMVDVDSFKAFNDTYGHTRGDECLRLIGAALAGVLKRPGDLVARYGGEEFAVVLPNTEVSPVLKLVEKLRTNVEQLEIPHQESTACNWVTISIGLAAQVPQLGSQPSQLIDRADQALYQAKREGRNRVVVAG